MIRLLLIGVLMYMVGDWGYSVYQMTQTDNIYIIHQLAGHASNIGFWMLGVLVLFILDYKRRTN